MRYSTCLLASLAIVGTASAQDTFPINGSAASTFATEDTAPFVIPFRMTQSLVVNRNTLVANGLNPSLINWDMVAFSSDSRYIFIPAENFGGGGGLFRYDTQTGAHVEIMTGNGLGPSTRNPNAATFNHLTDETSANDPCTWTPHGTVIFGEETTGGRMFEVMDPLNPTGPFNVIWRTAIPAVNHEGLRFDSQGVLYFIDENNSGCIYKFVPTVTGDLSAGQTFVLSVDGYANDPNAVPTENFNSTSNRLTNRAGPATWVPITDANGGQITPTDPFVYVTANSGRMAADEVFGTPFGRPEDLDVGVLANGNEVVYAAITSENRVLSIELVSGTTAIVRDFVNYDTINLHTGLDVNPTQQDPFTSPGSDPDDNFDDPDNLAVGPNGAVYILEDEDPGDIWKAIDADGDGVAEAIGIFMSLGVDGSEPTGMLFDPNDPYRCIVNIQHPASGNDALWSFRTRPYPGSDADLELLTGVNETPRTGPGEYVRSTTVGDVVNVRLESPSGSLESQPYAIVIQGVSTSVGPMPLLPPLWISPLEVSIVLAGGAAGPFPAVLPIGGASVAVTIPSGLSGVSAMTQGIVITPAGTLAVTDAVEVVL